MNRLLLLSKLLVGLVLICLLPCSTRAQAPQNDASATITVIQGTVEVAPAGTDNWAPAALNQKLKVGDRVRTGKLSRAVLRSPNVADTPVRESSLLTINAPRPGSDRPVFELVRGFFYFFTRGQPTDVEFRNRIASAAARGTEFTVWIDDNDRIEINVIDGIVELANAQGSEAATNNQQVVAVPGQRPVKSPSLNAMNLVQWVLYYPGVLHVDELAWDDATKTALNDSLAAYRNGDLVQALNLYPANRQPGTDVEKTYRAALMLVAGEVDQAKAMLDSLTAASEYSIALRKVIAAVRNEQFPDATAPSSGTAWVAESYYQQSRLDLEKALQAARTAAERAPQFGFAWARVAELEFSFGRIDPALAALDRALSLSPRHAEALALKGFLLSAQNRIRDAIKVFDQALAIDSALPDAWLGRGLCKIRRGDAPAGREDLRTAAALEPNRALLRSYLGKAFSDAGRAELATHEFTLAKQIDPNDPTVWLYSALHSQQENRINDAIRQLQKSQDLNNNRAVYRSQMLLDQDEGVRSANLASIYYDAGMIDVSVREAGRAVSYDYANYSAHLFLANSYERLRDPRQVNLRYETPAFAEYLIANLLAPVGAGPLSPAVSQQEYSKLFERDRLGVSSVTEYQSSGAWFENGAQYGTFGNTSYALEGYYRSDPGQRQNNDLEQRQLSIQFKQQLTPHDTIYVQATDARTKTGDLTQHFDQDSANPFVHTIETQEPIVLAGYHREWSPGHHTLFLASRLDDSFSVIDPRQSIIIVATNTAGINKGAVPSAANEDYKNKLTIYSAELQQIATFDCHSTVLGARYQDGEFRTDVNQNKLVDRIGFLGPFVSAQDFTTDFQRVSFYGYHSWRVVDQLQLIGGLAYDYLKYPRNFRFAPVNGHQDTETQLSPKAGFVWTPTHDTAIRFAFTRSLAGASIDQSFQIEPSQVAGFNQTFRSIIPESVAGANAAARFETFDLSLEHNFPTETYVGIAGELLHSNVRRQLGAVKYNLDSTEIIVPVTHGFLGESLNFREISGLLTINQLVGEEWAFGGRYRVTRADLNDDFPQIANRPAGTTLFDSHHNYDAVLHQVILYAIYNHPSGVFAQAQALWNRQTAGGFGSADGDDFWQGNVFAGYRFWQRHAELTVGVLNVGDTDYMLQPLTLYSELPRERTFVARFSFKF
jgi:tetratricopeptide (TPR) repeat protein